MILPRSIFEAMLSAGRAALPREAAGVLFGRPDGDRLFLDRFVPLENVSDDPLAFRLDPAAFACILRTAEDRPLAFFHTHPTDIASPSGADIAGARDWTDAFHLILSLKDRPHLRCWRLFDGQAMPEPLVIEDLPAGEGTGD